MSDRRSARRSRRAKYAPDAFYTEALEAPETSAPSGDAFARVSSPVASLPRLEERSGTKDTSFWGRKSEVYDIPFGAVIIGELLIRDETGSARRYNFEVGAIPPKTFVAAVATLRVRGLVTTGPLGLTPTGARVAAQTSSYKSALRARDRFDRINREALS